jgi:hypothetical protein
MRRSMIALVAMASLVSVPAFAEQLENYGAVKLGIYSPRSYFSNGNDFSKGFDGELALGHYFHRHLAGEVGLGYFRTTAGSDQMTVIPVTVTGKDNTARRRRAVRDAGIGAHTSRRPTLLPSL